jgi:hypothetical protein
MQRTPQTIAAHLRTILAPALAALTLPGDEANKHARTMRACATTLDGIDLAHLAAHLAYQRATAAGGRPRGEGGARPRNTISDPTGDTANELHRIIDTGMTLRRALDRIHPDPDWPSIESGWRAMASTSTEAIAALIEAVRVGESPAVDLGGAVECCADNVREAAHAARNATGCRAWLAPRALPADVDPPDPIREANRCAAWWLGANRDGDAIRCTNWRSEHRDANGTEQHSDLCDDHWAELCKHCHTRPRRTKGASECMACEIRNRRQRAA